METAICPAGPSPSASSTAPADAELAALAATQSHAVAGLAEVLEQALD